VNPRRHQSIARWIAVTLLVTGWLVPMTLPHSAADDRLCFPFEGLVGGADSHLVPDVGSERPTHCAICHAIRSFRTTLIDSGPVAIALALGPTLTAPADVPHRALTFDRLPARAPPIV
jgi:hypothetical protein